jgi:hypothetical protein
VVVRDGSEVERAGSEVERAVGTLARSPNSGERDAERVAGN